MARRITAFLVGLLLVLRVAGAQERFGSLAGTVTDTTKAAVPGATVTATNKETGAQRVVVTDPTGRTGYPTSIPAATRHHRAPIFQKVVVDDRDRPARPDADRRCRAEAGVLTEVVSVTGMRRDSSTSSVTLAHNVTAEEFDRLPKGRSFQSIAMTAPGVNSGEVEGGFQVNGASGAENSFTVDGVATNSLIYGSSRQNTVFEYLQEVQVKTGGIAAEYGGALGGVISAVTKSGGNAFTRRRPLLLHRQRARRRPGEAARARPGGLQHRRLLSGRRSREQPERVRRFDRRPDRQGPAVLLRLGLSARRPAHRTTTCSRTAPSLARS